MNKSLNLSKKSFAVYGLGVTGDSVFNFLSKNGAYKIYAWDDYLIKSNLYLKNRFIRGLNTVDYIVMSPGINILKSTNVKRDLYTIQNHHFYISL